MFKKTLLAALVSGVMISGVQAAEIQPNGYLFGNVGQSDADASDIGNGLDALSEAIATDFGFEGSSSFDEKDSAFKIGAGIQLNPHVAVEFQYIDLGEIAYKSKGVNSSGETGVLKATSGTEGFGASLVGTLPFDRFKLFGKVGYHKLKTEVKASIDLRLVGGAQFSDEEKDDATEWVNSLGVGASFAFTPTVELVAEYERYSDVADEYDVDFASIGLRYNF
ncbi:porin family protein [Pseudomonas saliphila]|uniref:porin family protein n=1 Tax=Pseudomonas saliphila TaxID=2586906 RepID=UPI0015B4078D|nr:outer membrane beta-barrel protein [Pseudomonas saliphila]